MAAAMTRCTDALEATVSELIASDTALIEAGGEALDKVLALQSHLAEAPQFDFPVMHHFTAGAYARQLFMPEGTVIVGRMHRTEHLLFVSGDVTILNGGERERVEGVRVLNTQPGTKRAIYAHADTTLITFHITDSRDLAEIEAAILVPEPGLLAEGGES